MSGVKISPKALADMKGDRKRFSPAELAERYSVPVWFARYHTRDIQPAKRTFLADKEDEILMLVGLGHTQSDIAHQLGVSPSSINKALARMEWKAAA